MPLPPGARALFFSPPGTGGGVSRARRKVPGPSVGGDGQLTGQGFVVAGERGRGARPRRSLPDRPSSPAAVPLADRRAVAPFVTVLRQSRRPAGAIGSLFDVTKSSATPPHGASPGRRVAGWSGR